MTVDKASLENKLKSIEDGLDSEGDSFRSEENKAAEHFILSKVDACLQLELAKFEEKFTFPQNPTVQNLEQV